MPSAPPSHVDELIIAAARPALSAGTPACAAVVTPTNTAPSPRARITSGGRRSGAYEPAPGGRGRPKRAPAPGGPPPHNTGAGPAPPHAPPPDPAGIAPPDARRQ